MDNNISVVKRRNSRLNMWGSKNKKENLVRDDTCMILLRHLIELILGIFNYLFVNVKFLLGPYGVAVVVIAW
jgi:hypothetical protein